MTTSTTRRRTRLTSLLWGVAALGAGAATAVATGALGSSPGAPGTTRPDATGTRTADAPGPAAAPPLDVDGLDPELRRRFDEARTAAAEEGVALTLTSGRRTAQEQQALVDDALARYGSAAEAHRWVAPVDGSAHVTGTAVDVGPTEGVYWLAEHGWRFGLCQVFANEAWHFEPTVEPGGTCGPTVPDASVLWP